MKKRFIALLLAIFGSSAQAADYRDNAVQMQAVTTLELDRYMGRWHEIARFPNRFEKDCVGVTADYTLRDDNTVKVVNTCHKKSSGVIKEAKGVAYPVGEGKLEVSFVPALSFLPFLRADYWVLDITADYTLAVVGAPGGNLGWILSRSPQISQAQLDTALSVFQRNGYDTTKIELVPQLRE